MLSCLPWKTWDSHMSTSSTCLVLARFPPVRVCITSTKTFLFVFARSVLSPLPAWARPRFFPVRSLGFGAEFSLRRTRSVLPPKPSISCSWAVCQSSFLCSRFGCQCCLYSNLLSAPKSSAGWGLPGHRLAVLHLVSLECAVRVFHFLLLSPQPALKFSLSPASDVCFLLVIFLSLFLEPSVWRLEFF
jgi:hypothetical protein